MPSTSSRGSWKPCLPSESRTGVLLIHSLEIGTGQVCQISGDSLDHCSEKRCAFFRRCLGWIACSRVVGHTTPLPRCPRDSFAQACDRELPRNTRSCFINGESELGGNGHHHAGLEL